MSNEPTNPNRLSDRLRAAAAIIRSRLTGGDDNQAALLKNLASAAEEPIGYT